MYLQNSKNSELCSIQMFYLFLPTIAAPVVSVTAQDRKYQGGETIELRCNVQGSPPPRITWEKYQGELPNEHTIRNGVLT